MLGARRVPQRNDQGVFEREERLTLSEATTYLTRLFRDDNERPIPAARLSRAWAALGQGNDSTPVARGAALTALLR